MSWTTEQILALAPDASSAKSGKDLAAARKWSTLGADDTSAWGTIQGSGKSPYQTSIDLTAPAFKCSCPSRKFPCKHGLGLLLIFAQQPAAMTEKNPPAWTTEWLAKRVEKEEKKIAKAAEPETPPDPEAAAKAAAAAEKRAVSREARVTTGMDELGIWLDDLVRTGFTALPGKPSTFWQTPAARLVDAQAGGIARRVSYLGGITARGETWPATFLREISLLHLAREGWSRINSLPEATQADLRAAIGFIITQPEVLAQPAVRDQWTIVAQRVEEEGLIRTQRSWLFGKNTKRPALCLSFSAGPNQPLDISLVPGATIDAELVFFPSAWPVRALVKQRHGSPDSSVPTFPHETIAAANAIAAEAFTANPWLERVPFAFASVTPVRRAERWILRDSAGHSLPLNIFPQKAHLLYALSGGHPVSVAGEWNGETFWPLSVWAEGKFHRL